MSYVTICDFCKLPIEKDDFVARVDYRGPRLLFGMKDICKKCWLDKKNWPKLHKLPQKK